MPPSSPGTLLDEEPSNPVIRFPRSGDQAIVVQILGLADQRTVIALAEAMESSPVLSDVSLACLTESDAWFTVRASSADAVADVVAHLSQEPLDIIVNQNLVEAHPAAAVTAVPPSRVQPGMAGRFPPSAFTRIDMERLAAEPARHDMASSEDQGSALPPRPRFRVFRPAAPGPVDDAVSAPAEQLIDEPELEASTEDTEGTVPEAAYYIVATQPFRSFSAVNTYHQAVHALEGVTSTHVQRFDRGTLYLAVTYQSRVPLRQRLERLEGYELEIVNENRSKIDVALRAAPLAARAGRA